MRPRSTSGASLHHVRAGTWPPRRLAGVVAVALALVAGACVPPMPEPPQADGSSTVGSGSTGLDGTTALDGTTTGTSPETTATTVLGTEGSTGSSDAGTSTDASTSATGSEDTTGDSTGEDPPVAPELMLGFSPVKQFDFTWGAVAGADYYQLEESPEPGALLMPLGGDVVGLAVSHEQPLHLRHQASYRLRACAMVGCTELPVVDVTSSLAEAVGYFKAAIPLPGDQFGARVALSADGSTLAVAAIGQDAGGVDSGAVYVFVHDGPGTWSQQALVKASNIGMDDTFGAGLALSASGDTLAVGALYEDSAATGIDGDQGNNAASSSGAAYVLVRDGMGTWSHQAYIKASNTGSGDYFGASVSLSADGNTLAVGAYGEDSSATGIDGDQGSNAASGSGAAYVFVSDGAGTWSQQAYIKASNPDAQDDFGQTLALSGDGNTLVVGAYGEDSAATGIDGFQGDNSSDAGAAYVFGRDGTGTWSQEAYVKASNTDVGDWFGMRVAISETGDTVAVSTFNERSSATGIDGDDADDSASMAGAVYVFERELGAWSQAAYVKASNTDAGDYFGFAVALSADGRVLAVGSLFEDGSAVGIGGDDTDDSAVSAGAVYTFVRDAMGAWAPRSYVKASNTQAGDHFGESLALSATGHTLAVGATDDASNASGVGGDQLDNSVASAGAVYLY